MKPARSSPREKTGEAAAARRTPEYRAWNNMLCRCYVPSTRAFARYGGRGIQVCKRWRDSYKAFLSDMGRRPSSKHSLERVDNDGNYEPGNCAWATQSAQNRNKQVNVKIAIDGRTLCATDWAIEVGLPPAVVLKRLRCGWAPEAAVFTPRLKRGARYKTGKVSYEERREMRSLRRGGMKLHEIAARFKISVGYTYWLLKQGNDNVNAPAHYTSSTIEPLDVIDDWKLDFHRAQCVKYIARAGRKEGCDPLEDLKKAQFYLNHYIALLEKGGK